jgi:DNA replication ATP-dependent helicase Dna2
MDSLCAIGSLEKYERTNTPLMGARQRRNNATVLAQDFGATYYGLVRDLIAQRNLTPKERIPQLCSILEQMLREALGEDHPERLRLIALIDLINERFILPEGLVDTLHIIRKIRNEATHNMDYQPGETNEQAAITAIIQLIICLSGEKQPEDLTQPTALFTPTRSHNSTIQVAWLRATVIHVGSVKTNTQGLQYCQLHCLVEEPFDFEPQRITVYCWHQWSQIADQAWQYASIGFSYLTRIPDKQDTFATTAESLIVLDPDFLVSASEIEKCVLNTGANPRLHLMSLFQSPTKSRALVLGQIVSTLLEEFVAHPRAGFDELFEISLKMNTLFLALSDDGEALMEGLRQDSKQHFACIQHTLQQLRGATLAAEVTFESEQVGLQGRLDALVSYSSVADQQDVIELKSGKVPNLTLSAQVAPSTHATGIWANHYLQATAYDLLLDAVYQQRRGTTKILYSGAQQEALRIAQPLTSVKQQVIQIRNAMIALQYALAYGNGDILWSLTPEHIGPYQPFLEEEIQNFSNVFRLATNIERAYFTAFVGFVARESRMAFVGADELETSSHSRADLWRFSFREKLERYSILHGLMLASIDEEGDLHVVFDRICDGSFISTLRVGDIAILYPLLDGEATQPLRERLLKCTVTELTPKKVVVKLHGMHIGWLRQNEHFAWVLEHDVLDNTFRNMYRSMLLFLKALPTKRQLLLGQLPPRVMPVDPSYFQNVNKGQKEVLANALGTRDYYLIQGPPGTGKTRVVIPEIVRYSIERTDDAIILLAFTNRAVNELCDAIPASMPFLILGSGANIASHHRNHLITTLTQSNFQLLRSTISSTRIFVSTVASALHYDEIFTLKHFAMAIVDEASQLLEPHLIGLLTKVDRFVLIGDEKQLPAVVQQSERATEVTHSELHDLGIRNLRTSLFERLLLQCQANGWHNAYGMLSEQHRMHPDIVDFPNHAFYSGKLQSTPRMIASLPYAPDARDQIERLLSRSRVLFIPTSMMSHRSNSNRQEADRTAALLQTLGKIYENHIAERIGVITFFRAQIAEILVRGIDHRILVDTVERFQGAEREIIIISFAVNTVHQLQTIQSLNSDKTVDRKLNVALTRAKSQLILLGRPDILAYGVFTDKLLKHILARGGYIRDWPPDRREDIIPQPHPNVEARTDDRSTPKRTFRFWWSRKR